MQSPEFTPDNAAGRMVNAPGFVRLRLLNGWRADGIPEVLNAAGVSVPVIGPYEIVEAKDVPDYAVRERQAALAAEAVAVEESAAEAGVRAAILDALYADLSVPEIAGGLTHRQQKVRRTVLERLGREGVCRSIGKRPENRCWLLATKYGDFTPAPAGSKVLVAGADAERIPDGVRTLVGMVAGRPAVLDRWTLPPTVNVVRSGVWKRPGAEDPGWWVQMARADLERAAEADVEDVRVQMLDRIAEEHAIVPVHEPERVLLEVLRSEGHVRRLGDAYVLAREVGPEG